MSKEETTPVTDVAENETAAAQQQEAEQPPAEVVAGTAGEEVARETLELTIEEIQALQREAQENLEGRQRTLAEFQNYKKRVERELKDSTQKAALDTLVKILPIMDDFERGLTNVPEDFREHSWFDGIALIQRKLQKILDEFEITVIDPVGEVFDPNRHEAIGIDEAGDVESGHVTVTLQKGYACGERVLRPALVRVAG